MSDDTYIYIGEAYNRHGERVERIAHTTRRGAAEDINTFAECAKEELMTNVCPLKLHGGVDGEVAAIETNRGP